MTEQRSHRKTPCRECPFLRTSVEGYLGGGSPERFVLAVLSETPLPCHSSIDYRDPDWKKKWLADEAGVQCAGSLIMAANMLKSPRDPRTPELPKSSSVFKMPQEFVAHHRSTGRGSWSESENRAGRAAWKKLPHSIAAIVLGEMPEPEE